MLVITSHAGWPQTAPPQPSLGLQEQPPQQAATQPSPQGEPARPENPGLINEMGKLFDKIVPPLKSPAETIDDLNTRAKEASRMLPRRLSRMRAMRYRGSPSRARWYRGA